MGAVQAQDYAAAKWAVGQRMRRSTDTAIDQAFADGAILRTHLLRPTCHFVSPADIRWILALTAPRVNAHNAFSYRQFGLDDATFMRSNNALSRALEGGKQFTRAELAFPLQQAGIATGSALRLSHIMMRAELDGIVCSGARRGKQFTYALLEERAPQARTLERDEALAELTERYFSSHGPATIQDFVWWSGLTTSDAKAGLAMVESQITHRVIDGQAYWFSASSSSPPPSEISQAAYLLPNFDEYTVGYKDRSAVFDGSHTEKLGSRGDILSNHTIVMDGQVVGTWKRTLEKSAVTIEARPFTPLTKTETRALAVAAERYGRFIGLPATLA